MSSRMTRSEAGKLGGIALAEKIKREYYDSPRVCEECDCIIPYEKKHAKRYCSRQCSGKAVNRAKRVLPKLTNCKRCGKEFTPKTKKGVFCSRACARMYEVDKEIEKWKETGEGGVRMIKSYLMREYGCKCTRCGWGDTNTYLGTIPLELEHIDGNSDNNSPDNLTILCPNCHSLTPTAKGANRGNGRYARRQRYREGKSS